MRYSLAAALRFLSFFLVLLTESFTTNAWSPPSLNSRSNSITIPIHAYTHSERSELSIRSPADNTTLGAGLTQVSLSSDKQYVLNCKLSPLFSDYALSQILLCCYRNG